MCAEIVFGRRPLSLFPFIGTRVKGDAQILSHLSTGLFFDQE
jgi:hypothetical protein